MGVTVQAKIHLNVFPVLLSPQKTTLLQMFENSQGMQLRQNRQHCIIFAGYMTLSKCFATSGLQVEDSTY